MARAKKVKNQSKTKADISAKDMDVLIEFLPLFEKPRFSFGRWSGGEVDSEGTMSMPYFRQVPWMVGNRVRSQSAFLLVMLIRTSKTFL